MNTRQPVLLLSVLALLAAGHALAAPPTSRESLLAARRSAYDANFRNDQAGLRAAVSAFAALETDKEAGRLALYYAGWSEWMLAASQLQDKQPASATTTLESAVRHLNHALELQPDDAETHTVLVFVLVAITAADPAKWKELSHDIGAHRHRALELAPRNPRVLIMDAMMIFYAPPQYGGGQDKGIARWLEALPLFATETFTDATQPDWGRTLAEGWLANLYLAMAPPREAEARAMATKALAERPDFWFVSTQVMPRTRTP